MIPCEPFYFPDKVMYKVDALLVFLPIMVWPLGGKILELYREMIEQTQSHAAKADGCIISSSPKSG
jgi:hypothetical protein